MLFNYQKTRPVVFGLLYLSLILALGLNLFLPPSLNFTLKAQAAPPLPADAIFDRFTFGFSNDQYNGGPSDPTSYRAADFGGPDNAAIVAGPWLLIKWDHFGDEHTSWLSNFNTPQNSSKIPQMTLYIAAGRAKEAGGLVDCNQGSPNLCQQGAAYIRDNASLINQAYIDTANEIKNVYGTTKPILLHIEPDFYQYHSDPQQSAALSLNESWSILNTWTASLKSILPNARLILDISPWNTNLAQWSGGFQNFSYAGLVGKAFPANGDGSVPNGIDGKTYAQMATDTSKQIIVNTAHGVGGGLLGHQFSWDDPQTIQDRLNDGVIAVLQPAGNAGSRSHYTQVIQNFLNNPVLLNQTPPNCTNGANNPPTCDVCPSGQVLVNNQCVANCTNGATNPPVCDNQTPQTPVEPTPTQLDTAINCTPNSITTTTQIVCSGVLPSGTTLSNLNLVVGALGEIVPCTITNTVNINCNPFSITPASGPATVNIRAQVNGSTTLQNVQVAQISTNGSVQPNNNGTSTSSGSTSGSSTNTSSGSTNNSNTNAGNNQNNNQGGNVLVRSGAVIAQSWIAVLSLLATMITAVAIYLRAQKLKVNLK